MANTQNPTFQKLLDLARSRNALFRIKDQALQAIKDELHRLTLKDQDDPSFKTDVVLVAAAFGVGPDIEGLVAFTGYSRNFVSDISCRMHDSGLWSNSEVSFDHWFQGEYDWTFSLALDSLVGEGHMVARSCHQGWDYEYTERGDRELAESYRAGLKRILPNPPEEVEDQNHDCSGEQTIQ